MMEQRSEFGQLTGVSLAALLLAGCVSAQLYRKSASSGDYSFFTARSGNRLAYKLSEAEGDNAGRDDVPLIVLQSGHQASDRFWHWIAEQLSEYPVLKYARAGYAASDYNSKRRYSLMESIEDFLDLANWVRGGRELIFIGHSLGGLLAYWAALEAKAPVRQVILLDPTHPEEIKRVSSKKEGTDILDRSYPGVATSLRCGFGLLLTIPQWVRGFPDPVAKLVRAEFRDYSSWQAAAREWSSLYQFFQIPPPLAALDVPVSVIAAEETVNSTEEQKELFQDYVDHGAGGSYQEIEGADHFSLVSSQKYAEQTAALVKACLKGVKA